MDPRPKRGSAGVNLLSGDQAGNRGGLAAAAPAPSGRRGRSRSGSEDAAVPVSMTPMLIVASRSKEWRKVSWARAAVIFFRMKCSKVAVVSTAAQVSGPAANQSPFRGPKTPRDQGGALMTLGRLAASNPTTAVLEIH